MKTLARLRQRAALLTFACAAATGLCLTGCSTNNNVTMASMDHRHVFSQTFKQAYSTINENGDYEICLIHDANDDMPADAGHSPVAPQTVTPRQLVEIRVFWKAIPGTKADHPASTNASIRWYLFGDRPDEGADLLEYAGSGLVMLSDNGQNTTLDIRGAFLKPVMRRGDMRDPMGPSTITGTVIAQVDPHRVQGLLAEAQAAESNANSGPNLTDTASAAQTGNLPAAARIDVSDPAR